MGESIRVQFSFDEIIGMAIQMETIGSQVYQRVAQMLTEASLKQLMLHLEEMEQYHKNSYMAMRANFIANLQRQVSDPPEQAILEYLRSWIEGKVFKRDSLLDFFKKRQTLENVLWQAIELEKDSIAFYSGLRDLVRDPDDKRLVNRIIQEELGHVVELGKLMRSEALDQVVFPGES